MAERAGSQLFDENQLSDLVRDARLATTVRAGETVHTIYSSTPEQPQPVLVEQSWKRVERLGLGSFGVVWLERCTNIPLGKIKGQRAVKVVTKDKGIFPVLRRYTDELKTIFKFSHKRVCCIELSAPFFTTDLERFSIVPGLPNPTAGGKPRALSSSLWSLLHTVI